MKESLLSRIWIDGKIPCKLEAGLIKEFLASENVLQ